MEASPSFSFGAHYELTVRAYRNVLLSAPAITQCKSVPAKDLLTPGACTTYGKFTLQQHLTYLQTYGKIETERPTLVIGARNNLTNLRCPIILAGQVYAVEEEEPMRSQRPYYGIGLRENRLICDTVLGDQSEPGVWDFFCAGIPVLWDDLNDDCLFDLMLCETADHSHLFNLPRGNHPAATDVTRGAWLDLHNVFIEHLYNGSKNVAIDQTISQLADAPDDDPRLSAQTRRQIQELRSQRGELVQRAQAFGCTM